MISAQDALKEVLTTAKTLGIQPVSFRDAVGRTLAEDIVADRPFPPFDRVTMDGIAISFTSYANGNRLFVIEDIGPAGAPVKHLKDPNKCIEIMTGAPLPKGTDTVIRYEDLIKEGDHFRFEAEITAKKNVHKKGSDQAKGSVLLKKGHLIKAIDVNVLASVGAGTVKVYKNPRVAIVSSGDELVEVNHIPLDYQIRKSNVYMLEARLRELGVQCELFHLKDNPDEIYFILNDLLGRFDVVLMSGGVSKGKFDYIPGTLERLGFEKKFHQVAQRPGKPFWFGYKPNKVVFAFPGNPVSSLACFHKYFIPWLNQSLSRPSDAFVVQLEEDVDFKPLLTYYAQATVRQDQSGRWLAKVSHGNGSGDIAHPTKMSGFIDLPSRAGSYKAGEWYSFMPFYPLI